jgi:hypothetical protein
MKIYQCKKSNRGPASPNRQGGNWPSTTSNPSGGKRGNAKPHN